MSRAFTTGFEFSSIVDNGLLSIDSEMSISGINPRKSAGGNGGNRALEANTTGANLAIFQPLNYELPDSNIRIYFSLESLPTTHEYIFYDSVGAFEIFKLRFSSSTGPFILSVNGVDVLTGTQTYLPNTYYLLKIGALIDAVGLITVEIDGFTDISYAGATNGGGTGWDQLRLNTNGHVNYDDIAFNDSYTRVNYDGGNGVTTPSGTLTGPGPSATIIDHVGDGTTGYFIVDNGGATFSDNDAITDSTTFTGTVNGDEDSSSTSAVPDGFVQLFFPNANGNTTGLTNSNEDMTDNYTYVNTFEDTSGFVFGETPGLKDTYGISDVPGEALNINHVDAYHFTKRDGSSITSIRSTLRVGSTDYDTHTENIPGSFRWIGFSIPENPDTQAPWSLSEINSAEMGPKIES